jgi:hypothetical protein
MQAMQIHLGAMISPRAAIANDHARTVPGSNDFALTVTTCLCHPMAW